MDRRSFLQSSGAAVSIVVAGCLSDDEPEDADDAEGPNDQNSGLPDVVDPTVTDLRHPDPRGVSTDAQETGGGMYDFSITIENTGLEGDLKITLVFLEDSEMSIWSPSAKEVNSFNRYFSDGERRTETFTAELESGYENYGFRFTAAEAEVDVKNDGAGGNVEVRLLQTGGVGDDSILEHKTVEMGAESARTVQFSIDSSFTFEESIDSIRLDAEAIPV